MALNVKVGSFQKATGGAPASQAITGLGFQPKALILFTNGCTALNTATDHVLWAIGFTAGASSSGSMGFAAQHGVTPSNTSNRAAAKALTIVQYGETLLAECDLTSFDADGFTLSWTTNNGSAYYIGYIALGGSDITDATVKSWTNATSNNEKTVTGVGFQPTVVFDLSHGGTTAPPVSATIAYHNFGVWCSDGTCASFSVAAQDNSTGTTQQQSVLSQAFNVATLQTGAYYQVGIARSFDADGFTYFQEIGASAYNHYSLCLRTLGAGAAMTYKPTGAAPVTDITSFFRGILPKAALFFADAKVQHASSGPSAPAYIGFGVSDGVSAVCMASTAAFTAGLSVAKAVFRDDASAVKMANNTGTQDAVAGVPTFSANTISVSWNPNDSVRMAHAWVAIGDALAANPSQATRLVGGVLA